MKNTFTLNKIIQEILNEEGLPDGGRTVYNNFMQLLDKIGIDKNMLKNEKNRFEFTEKEKNLMKILVRDIRNNGVICEFIHGDADQRTSSQEVKKLIQSFIEEADKQGLDEIELIEMAKFLENFFGYSTLCEIEECHGLIDCLALSLQDIPYSRQSLYMFTIKRLLKKEFARRIAESAISTVELAEILMQVRELYGEEVIDPYSEYDPEIRHEYMERDRAVLEKIQDDDDLRQYIEQKLGYEAEEIFNHVTF